jgi:hypothetical protein
MLANFSSLVELVGATAIPLLLVALLAVLLDVHWKDIVDKLF